MASTKRNNEFGYSDYLDYSKLKKIIVGPGIEAYTFEDEVEEDDETIPWDCDGCYELGDFDFDTDFEDDSDE